MNNKEKILESLEHIKPIIKKYKPKVPPVYLMAAIMEDFINEFNEMPESRREKIMRIIQEQKEEEN